MPRKLFQPSPHKAGIIKALNEGESKESILKRFPITARTLDRYVSKLRKGKTSTKELIEVGAGKTLAEKKPSGGTGLVEVKPVKPPPADSNLPPGDGDPPGQNLAAIVMRPPAPVLFIMGESKIDLEPQALYESYLLYEAIKVRLPRPDSFCGVIRSAMGIAWRLVASEPIIEGKQ